MKLVSTTVKLLLLGSAMPCACNGSGNGKDEGPASSARLFINELQPSNQDTVTDEIGDADDWIEIYNDSDAAVDMQGYGFTDSSGLSQVILGQVLVAPRAFTLFWADDSPGQGDNHLGFKLSASRGDEVALKDKTGRTVDSVSFGAATGQNTYARFPDGTGAFAWCAAPTPGASNGSACVAAPLPGGSGGAGGSTSGTGGAGAAGAGGGGGAGGLDGDGASLDSGL